MSSKKRSPWTPIFVRDCTRPSRCDMCGEFIEEGHLVIFLPTIHSGKRPRGTILCRECFIEWITGMELVKVL